MESEYKSIVGHEDIEVNAFGDVRYVCNQKPARVYHCSRYLSHYVKHNYGNKTISMFNLVGCLFVDNPNNYKFVIAKDWDNSNYQASNLEWVKSRRKVKVEKEN